MATKPSIPKGTCCFYLVSYFVWLDFQLVTFVFVVDCYLLYMHFLGRKQALIW